MLKSTEGVSVAVNVNVSAVGVALIIRFHASESVELLHIAWQNTMSVARIPLTSTDCVYKESEAVHEADARETVVLTAMTALFDTS